MPSSAAQRFNDACRPRMGEIHREDVILRRPGMTDVTISAIFRRVSPAAPQTSDGIGIVTYVGAATAVVMRATVGDLPARSDIIRDGETWQVMEQEPVDEWSWRLHLARPDSEERIPGRLRG